MNLVIVESPTKSLTISKFLGPKYKVLSSYGHIRDLPENEFGVDIKNNFKPKYIIIPKAKKNVQFLKKETEKASLVILATDPDREGEAIAYHLIQVLKLDKFQTNSKFKIQNSKPYQRVVFHEITKQAIEEALKHPRDIDMDLVDAQQARRVLDRIVGYKLSPFLWKKVARGLSAGRVQSVTVRLICEREEEIKNFKPQEYWTITAQLKKSTGVEKVNQFEATLVKRDGKVIPKLGIKTKKEVEEIVKDLEGAEYKVVNIEKKEVKRNPLPPFTTSTLQQEAWKRFKWPAKFTMGIAQQLYEKGLTTYHRTDSLNLSDLSLFAAKKFITENYGKEYWAGFLRKYKAKGITQEAHEAIRPTYPERKPEKVKIQQKLEENQYRLYELIWRRFIACQMAQASFDSTTVEIEAQNPKSEIRNPKQIQNSKSQIPNYTFRATGQILKFEGFLKVYPMKFEETELPPLEKEEILELIKLIPSQHFTQPPPRYTEATLIKTLEENGIGRPSTYAPIISTIQERNYIEKDEQKRFKPTEIGKIVNNLLVEHFPKIVDIGFTAEMEKDLDKIAQGEKKWTEVIREFYEPFEENLEKKYKEISKKDITEIPTEKKCKICGAPLVIRLGKYGKFYACSKFPKCKYTEPLEEDILKIKCPKCKKGEIVEKRTKKGKIFYACSNYPECDFALWDKPTGEKCPKCGSLLVKNKKGKIKCSNKKCNWTKNEH
ncbi:type I DNA topoisomerase [bacterium]|nr:type I DNA topoisomerase [bacterium]